MALKKEKRVSKADDTKKDEIQGTIPMRSVSCFLICFQ
jgi:hypothetical protein